MPESSIARTWNVCLPLLTFTVWGEVQAAKAPPSRLHSNPATARASVAVNVKVACFFLVLSLGPLVIAALGAMLSPAAGSPPGGGADDAG